MPTIIVTKKSNTIVIPGVKYAGIGEPPSDGIPYSRANGIWVESPGATGGESNTLYNQGEGEGELTGLKVGMALGIKTIVGGEYVTIDNGANEVTINVEPNDGFF